MNKEIEKMTNEELIEFINSENERVVKELTDNDGAYTIHIIANEFKKEREKADYDELKKYIIKEYEATRDGDECYRRNSEHSKEYTDMIKLFNKLYQRDKLGFILNELDIIIKQGSQCILSESDYDLVSTFFNIMTNTDLYKSYNN